MPPIYAWAFRLPTARRIDCRPASVVRESSPITSDTQAVGQLPVNDEQITSNEDSAPNIFREGKSLVVPREGAVFPPRCVKTNEPVETADYPVRQKLLVNDFVARSYGEGGEQETWQGVMRAAAGVGGAVGGAVAMTGIIASIAASPVMEVRVGLCPSRRTANTWNRRLSLGLMVLGVLMLVGGIGFGLLIAFSIDDPLEMDKLLPVPLFSFMSGFGAVLIGAAWYWIMGRPVIAPGKHDERYAWFSGAGEAFRESLPEFPLFWDGERWRTKEWPG